MKNNKIYKIVWVSGIYLFLILVLILVVEYKVKWEGRDLYKYLYFYDCSGRLCSTDMRPSEYYSKYLCKKTCPRIKNIIDDNVILLEGINNGAIYNYKEGKIINDNYVSYDILSQDKFIVSNGNKKGIIDIDGKVILDFSYDDILSGDNNYIKIKNNNLWGIRSIDDNKELSPNYDTLEFVNDNILLVSLNNQYYFINYDGDRINEDIYNYLYFIDDYIIAIKNRKINILYKNLHSRLSMEIDTTYDYDNESQRNSLYIASDNEYIYFTVYRDNQYIKYKYSKERNTISF